jgi:PBSX family phage terminase large subunit
MDFVSIMGDYVFELAHGGRGSGKSKGGAFKAMAYQYQYPGALGIVVAPTFDMVRSATMEAVRRVWNEAGFIQGEDYELYTSNNRNEMLLANGGKILFRSTENPERLRGLDAAWFWMDEGGQSPLAAFNNLTLSIRQQGFPHMGWITTTPVGKNHWLYDVFFKNNEVDTAVSHTGATFYTFPARTKDNPFGGEELYNANIDRLGGPTSMLARQELEGEFILMEGLVYPDFTTQYHVVPTTAWPVKKPRYVIAGVDFGWSAPSAILVEGYHPTGEGTGYRFLMDEMYQAKLVEEDLIQLATRLKDKHHIRFFVADSEDPRFIAAMRRAGLRVRAAKKRNTMVYRKAVCTSALLSKIKDGDDEKQGFYVAPHLRHYISEISNYSEREQREGTNPDERPRSFENHLMDAWAYSEMEIQREFMGNNKMSVVKSLIK